VLVTLLILAIVPLAERDAPLSAYLALGGGMLIFQFTIGLVNDIVDVEDDRTAKPWKPLVRYELSATVPTIFAVGMAITGLLITLQLPWRGWVIGVLGLLCGLSYDMYFKRTDWSWLPYSIAFPLVPLWVYVALDTWRPMLWWVLPLGILAGFALHLANQAPDAGAGRAAGLSGRLGEPRSMHLAVVLFEVVAVVVVVLIRPDSASLAVAAAVVAAAILGISLGARRLIGRNGMFHMLALGSAALTVLFLLSV
jgi:4-hydroxybenzoate polyprenyltransferase